MKVSCFVFAVGGFILLPLIYSSRTLDPAIAVRLVWAPTLLTVTAALLLVSSIRSDRDIRVGSTAGWLFGLVGLYLLLGLVSLRSGPVLADWLIEVVRVMLWSSVIVVTYLLLNPERDCTEKLSISAGIAILVLSFIGMCQYYGWAFQTIPGYHYPYATLTNKNLLASGLLLLLPWAVYALVYGSRGRRWLAGVATLTALHIVILAFSRAVWLALIVAIVTFFALWWTTRLRGNARFPRSSTFRRDVTIIGAAVAVIVIGTGWMAQAGGRGSVTGRVMESVNFETGSVRERLTLWDNSLAMIADHPLRGVGLGQWRLHRPPYGSIGLRAVRGDSFYQRPHNDFLWVAAETGVIGGLTYLGIFVLAIIGGWRTMRRATDNRARLLTTLSVCGIMALLVISSFSFPRERIAHLFFGGVLFAVAMRPPPETKRTINARTVRVILIAVILGGCFSIIAGIYRFQGEYHTDQAWRALGRSDYEAVVRHSIEAESLFYHIDPVSTPLPWFAGVARLSQNKVDEARSFFERAREYHPHHPHVLSNLAACYERSGDHKKAAQLYEQALTLAPRFHEALVNLGAVYYNDGRYKQSLNVLRKAGEINMTERVQQYLDAVNRALKASPREGSP